MKHLVIVLGQSDPLTLQFQIRNTPVAQLWVDRMQSRGDYPWIIPKDFTDLTLRSKSKLEQLI